MRRAWGGAELAERLGVTTRTVRNDVERLRVLGYWTFTTGADDLTTLATHLALLDVDFRVDDPPEKLEQLAARYARAVRAH